MQRRFLLALAAILPAAPALSQTCEDRSNDYAARIAACDQAFAAAETNDAAAYALSFKGEAQRMLGDFAGASETLQYALTLTPENAWIWVELGNVRFDEGNTTGAIAHYSAAIAVEDYIDAYANRADGWWSLRAAQRCSDDADNALRIDPQYAYANEIKGRCLIDLGQPEQALGYFDTAIALSPGYQNAYRNKMTALYDLGRYPDVVAVADAALAPGAVTNSNPGTEEAISALRLIAFAQYAPPDAVATEADALLQRYPGNFAGINIKGMALISAGRAADADKITAIMRQNPDGLRMEGAYFDTLAQIDIALGRLEDAYTNFASAIDSDPGLSKIYAKKLSELGFLPLSNAPAGVLTALHRCIDVKKQACTVAG
jgi:tetratricopeptide (TPR) repeat protein